MLNLLKYLREEYNISKNITTFGYSDAGWLGSILGYLGYVNKVIAFSGYSFKNFDNCPLCRKEYFKEDQNVIIPIQI